MPPCDGEATAAGGTSDWPLRDHYAQLALEAVEQLVVGVAEGPNAFALQLGPQADVADQLSGRRAPGDAADLDYEGRHPAEARTQITGATSPTRSTPVAGSVSGHGGLPTTERHIAPDARSLAGHPELQMIWFLARTFSCRTLIQRPLFPDGPVVRLVVEDQPALVAIRPRREHAAGASS